MTVFDFSDTLVDFCSIVSCSMQVAIDTGWDSPFSIHCILNKMTQTIIFLSCFSDHDTSIFKSFYWPSTSLPHQVQASHPQIHHPAQLFPCLYLSSHISCCSLHFSRLKVPFGLPSHSFLCTLFWLLLFSYPREGRGNGLDLLTEVKAVSGLLWGTSACNSLLHSAMWSGHLRSTECYGYAHSFPQYGLVSTLTSGHCKEIA